MFTLILSISAPPFTSSKNRISCEGRRVVVYNSTINGLEGTISNNAIPASSHSEVISTTKKA
ncbi:hypothetical protein ACE38W_04995 [Chitinophaga sp. Hz27]|uniref:hypothetical protein n=1 Tax=Chitinophaga sp. Hz27 TaxID=3347169 RepID=UPI0035E2F0F0